jgi:DNA-binding HxlR family transcriptional regulator
MSQSEHTCMIRGDGGRTIRMILDRICDKWTLLIVATLDHQRLRFTDLQRQIPGISQRMLTLTLRNLERDGLVSRTAYAEVPPRVEYALTPIGRSLIPPALALAGWCECPKLGHRSRPGDLPFGRQGWRGQAGSGVTGQLVGACL